MASILIVYRSKITRAAPIISFAEAAADLGHYVSWLSPYDYSYTFRNQITLINCPFLFKSKYKLFKLIDDLIWGIKVYSKARNYSIAYIVGADAIISSFLLRYSKNHIIYHLRELHDQNPLYILLLRLVIKKKATVVTPEINRAYIYKFLLGLNKIPFVLENMPLNLNSNNPIDNFNLPKKYILYQGLIHKERDLTNICKAIKEMSLPIPLVCLGKDLGMLIQYKNILGDLLIHIDHIDPPNHLTITAKALIGLCIYNKNSLNTIYCAPNKVFEYSCFGVPILSTDNESLKHLIGANKIGLLVSEKNTVSEISELIEEIILNHEKYKANAKKFYDSFNYRNKVSELLSFY